MKLIKFDPAGNEESKQKIIKKIHENDCCFVILAKRVKGNLHDIEFSRVDLSDVESVALLELIKSDILVEVRG